ncbi:DUF2288 domain-containing protein [Mangrovitalea sediminis]|uniref:DUF2288 domain-containing protein n=1 Tax=Mangrovitalea sediminis TaxID=1982043 RepID=UPI001D0D7F6B|nr:DUF2288 domain-containing protein [Mangrovitalea sediminis]
MDQSLALNEQDATLREKLNQETSRIRWVELQPFYARGQVVHVATDMNLLDAAMAVARDDRQQVELWMADGSVAGVSDEQARSWFDGDAELWTVVVAPWVLVQDRAVSTPSAEAAV